METFLEDDGLIQFQYVMTKQSDHTINFDVYEVLSWGPNDDTKTFDVPSRTQLYLKAYMKWDGCYHFWFGESDGYQHLCGNAEIEKHISVMNKCIEFAKTKIKAYNPEVAE